MMEFKTKRQWSFVIASLFAFVGGCEIGVILPTLWDYLKSLGVTDSKWLGFTLAGFSTAGAISGLVGGRVSDKHPNKTKSIALVGVLIRIVGNIQYTLGFYVWNIWFARVLGGIGVLSGSVMQAEVCRITAPKERTRIIAIFKGARQLGILFGPVFQLALQNVNFNLFGFVVNPLNASGLFLTILCMIPATLCVLFFHNLVDEFNAIQRKEIEREFESESSIEDDVNLKIENESTNSQYEITPSSSSVHKEIKNHYNMLYQCTFIVFMFTAFTVIFCEMNVETMVPIIMEDTFGYGDIENSLVYMIGGISALVVFAGVACLSKRVRDTTFLMVGVTFMMTGQLILLYYLPQLQKDNVFLLFGYLSGFLLISIGYPLAGAANAAMYSKFLKTENQGLGQAFVGVITFVGLGLAPIWAGATVKMPHLYMAGPIVIMILNMGALAAKFNEVQRIECKEKDKRDDESSDVARRSLIKGKK